MTKIYYYSDPKLFECRRKYPRRTLVSLFNESYNLTGLNHNKILDSIILVSRIAEISSLWTKYASVKGTMKQAVITGRIRLRVITQWNII